MRSPHEGTGTLPGLWLFSLAPVRFTAGGTSSFRGDRRSIGGRVEHDALRGDEVSCLRDTTGRCSSVVEGVGSREDLVEPPTSRGSGGRTALVWVASHTCRKTAEALEAALRNEEGQAP